MTRTMMSEDTISRCLIRWDVWLLLLLVVVVLGKPHFMLYAYGRKIELCIGCFDSITLPGVVALHDFVMARAGEN